MLNALCRAAAVAALFVCGSAAGAIVERWVTTPPIQVKDIAGNTHTHSFIITYFYDDARNQAPFLIILHGRRAAEELPAMGRQDFKPQSRYFVSRGYAVFVPTRVGYGDAGGPDVENSGTCGNRQFAPAFDAGAVQAEATIRYAKRQPFVDPSRGVVVGVSVGGAIAVAMAGKGIDGVRATINFSGGGGGRGQSHPKDPCSEGNLRKVFATYGARARVPTLWLYSTNDKLWGPQLPHEWFKVFRDNGGKGAFVQLPPHGDNGHDSFMTNGNAWAPAVQTFLGEVGLPK